MIHAVRCNKSTFKNVEFKPGFNVVLADRTKESTRKDSRNGLGKSTLIEIIHFCLGAQAQKGKGLIVNELDGWRFFLDLTLAGKNVTVYRDTSMPSKIYIDGDCSDWPIQPQINTRTGVKEFTWQRWNNLLGLLMFGITPDDHGWKYKPTFRSLISFFIRRGKGAFLNPFENFPRQKEFDKQINNAFLLNLSWEDASHWQILKEQEKAIDNLKIAAKSGLMNNLIGSLGELEAIKMRLEQKVSKQEEQLKTFKVHPKYNEIEDLANKLTQKIHASSNQNIIDRKVLSNYENSLLEERVSSINSVVQVYEEAKISIPDMVKKHLKDVMDFHRQLINYRRTFLVDEMNRLRADIQLREDDIKEITEERAVGLEILQTHGALEEYTKLQQNHLKYVSELKDIEVRIDNLKKFEQGKSSIRIEKELLHQKALKDYDERRNERQKAVDLFNLYSEALYQAPGKLLINISKTGFKFDVEIERSGSEGISHMKVFCYDLMLTRLWSKKQLSPQLLIHDSTIFDPVDSRQVVNALELAAKESKEHGFQYICALNSDRVPWEGFNQNFDLKSYMCLRLTDATEDGSLLGIRF